MRILSNLAITGSINSSGMILLPTFVSASDVSASYSSSFGGAPDRLAMFTFQDLVPKVIGPGDISTEIGCRTRNRIDEKTETLAFYNCIVTASADPTISSFDLNGTTIDKSGSIYSGSERRNYSSNYLDTLGYIAHRSEIPSLGKIDFSLRFQPRVENELSIDIDCTLPKEENIQKIVDKFQKLFCNCLKSGEFIDLNFYTRCETGFTDVLTQIRGTIRFEKCFGKCTVTTTINTGGIVGSGLIDNTGSMVSISGYSVPWGASSFNYELTTITGSESAPSASGALTASTVPYVVIPSAPASPQTYYPFDGLLSDSTIKSVPGLVYFDTNASTLFVYDGTGSWNPAGSSKYTESVGNGTASIFVVTHSKNTRDVMVTVRETGAPYEIVYPTVYATSVNTIALDFSPTVPSVNQYTVIVV
jgi:hypothetical protein